MKIRFTEGVVCLLLLNVFVPAVSAVETEADVAQRKQKIMEKVGGLIELPGKGKVSFVNFTKCVNSSVIATQVVSYNRMLRVKMETSEETAKFELGQASSFLKKTGANAALFIVDDTALPMSLVAPEMGWGVLNVGALKVDHPSDAVFANRFKKALARATAVTFGAYTSQYLGSPLSSVRSLSDLDKLVNDEITVDALMGMGRNFEAIGVTKTRRCSYKRACFEGWAPAPTNQWQKAIYENVRKNPSENPLNPIKIEFPKKHSK